MNTSANKSKRSSITIIACQTLRRLYQRIYTTRKGNAGISERGLVHIIKTNDNRHCLSYFLIFLINFYLYIFLFLIFI